MTLMIKHTSIDGVSANSFLMKGGLMSPIFCFLQPGRVNTNPLSEWSPAYVSKSSSSFLLSVQFSTPKHVRTSHRQLSRQGTTLKSLPLKLGNTGSLRQTDCTILRRRCLGRLGRGLYKQGPLCSSERPVSSELPVAITR